METKKCFSNDIFIDEKVYDKLSFHWHDSIEILYITEGSLELTDWSGTYALKEGEFFVVGLNNTHLIEPTSSEAAVLEIHVNGIFCKERIDGFDEKLIHLNSVIGNDLSMHDDVEFIRNEILMINEMRDNREKETLLEHVEKLLNVVYTKFDFVALGYEKRKLDKKRENRCKAIYTEFFNDKKLNITLREIAEKKNVNYHHLCKDISNIYKKNFKRLQFDYLIERAVKKLISTNNNITEISYESGFSDPKYFIKYFKEKYNCTPTEFRLKCIKNYKDS